MTSQFQNPTRVSFADDVAPVGEIVRAYPPGPVALVTGGTAAREHGYIDAVRSAVDSREVLHFDRVEPEPSHSTVERIADWLSHAGVVAVVALGGGSVLDASKAAACLAAVGTDIAPYMEREIAFSQRKLPLIALPTTAGTGSEVTPFSVLTNDRTGQKKSLPSPYFYPDHAVVVPAFATTVPTKVRGDVGIDSLAHALEALWSVNANPVSDALAFRAIAHIAPSFEAYYDSPSDETAAPMVLGSTLAGLAFSNTLTAGCHALSYPLCDELHISHGAACAITLEHIAVLNQSAVADKFAVIATILGLDSGDALPTEISRLRRHATTIPTLSELGVTETDLSRIAKGAFQPLLHNNPVPMPEEVIVDVLRRAL
jgi:alcohol dehydrogenase